MVGRRVDGNPRRMERSTVKVETGVRGLMSSRRKGTTHGRRRVGLARHLRPRFQKGAHVDTFLMMAIVLDLQARATSVYYDPACTRSTPVALRPHTRASSQLPTRRMLKKERSRRGARTGADLGTGGTMYHRAKRQGRAWLRGHFPYNEFAISRCAAGAHRACARGTMPRAPLRRTGL